MKYRLLNPIENKAAHNRLNYLSKKKRIVEIKEYKYKRTLPQNSYLHLLLAAFGLNFGYTLEESKLIYKEVNREIYYYKKKNRTFIRSSASLNKEEMAKSIDKFMDSSAKAGFPLPLATDQEWLLEIENEMERQGRWM